MIDAPQWLVAAWRRAVVAAGATAGTAEVEALGERLLTRWQAPSRRFHDLRHLTEVLAKVDELAPEAQALHLVQLAAWYHGVVFSSRDEDAYARKGGEDADASALLAQEELLALGVPAENARRVRELVVALSRHDPGEDADAALLCDADLAILAAEPQRYRAYTEDVRAEYAHIPERHFLEARAAIVSRLLARPSVFVTPLARVWEEAARQNLDAELQRLRSALDRLEAQEQEAHGADGPSSGPADGAPSSTD